MIDSVTDLKTEKRTKKTSETKEVDDSNMANKKDMEKIIIETKSLDFYYNHETHALKNINIISQGFHIISLH